MTENIPTEDNGTLLTFDSRDQAAKLALDLINEARQEICFFGPLIDPVLFDNDAAAEKLSEFARRSPRTRIRIVVNDTQKNVVNSHRLLPLAQKLTSSIDIHIAGSKHRDLRQQYMLVDGKAYLFCPVAERYQGRAEMHAPAAVREMQQDFEEIWNHSKPDINTRRLNL
jgi:hypothetical protein